MSGQTKRRRIAAVPEPASCSFEMSGHEKSDMFKRFRELYTRGELCDVVVRVFPPLPGSVPPSTARGIGLNANGSPRDGGKMVGPHRDGGGATHPHQDFPAHRIGPRAAALPPFARRALPSRAPD